MRKTPVRYKEFPHTSKRQANNARRGDQVLAGEESYRAST
jgi:hypothetical protein